MLPHLFTETHTSDTKAGELTLSGQTGLDFPEESPWPLGALAHMGAVGASVALGILTRIMGNIHLRHHGCGKDGADAVSRESAARWTVRCFRDSSVFAGQSAFGDIYAWFRKMLAWTLKDIPEEARQKVLTAC